jgi:hypothetical protein
MTEDKQPTIEELAKELSLEQKDFCDYYVTPSEFYGNGTQSYLAAYGPSYKTRYHKEMDPRVANACARDLLLKPVIFNYINAKLETGGFNNENVDKQHLFVINQHSDIRSKIAAIDSYNKLKKRIDNKVELILPKPLLDAVRNNNSDQEDSILNQKD